MPPDAWNDCVVGEMENEQPGGGGGGGDGGAGVPSDWLIVIVCPATDTIPVRAGPLFAATVICTVPLPLPVPLRTAIQPSTVVADQRQGAAAWIVTETVPPEAGTERFAGDTLY